VTVGKGVGNWMVAVGAMVAGATVAVGVAGSAEGQAARKSVRLTRKSRRDFMGRTSSPEQAEAQKSAASAY
jgi:hypothetical protein